jgi:glycosyltransferase involved in cell wall biosynthesis
VQPYLWKSAVSVAPLLLAQGLQTKVLEALAAGLPVVVTTAVREGLPSTTERGCLTANRPEEFADAVLRLLRCTPDERRCWAAAAAVETLRWHARLQDLEGILREASIRDRNSSGC